MFDQQERQVIIDRHAFLDGHSAAPMVTFVFRLFMLPAAAR